MAKRVKAPKIEPVVEHGISVDQVQDAFEDWKKNHYDMDAGSEAHLSRVLDQVHESINVRYRNGQHEHGGKLWQKPGALDNAIQEATDTLVYLITLREQLQGLVAPAGSRLINDPEIQGD